MSGWTRKASSVGTTLGAAALGASMASGRLAIYFALSLGPSVVVLGAICSFTWLRTLKYFRELAQHDGRLPMITKHLAWDFQEPKETAVQGQLFEFPGTKRNRWNRRGLCG